MINEARSTGDNSFVPEKWRALPVPAAEAESTADLGIAVFGFNRPRLIESTLTSLAHQHALKRVHVFIDGDQGNPAKQIQVDAVEAVARRFAVAEIHRRRGSHGFRKMILQAMAWMSERYDAVLFLEDDCFPTRQCVEVFRQELREIAGRDDIFSVYGHHFGLKNESVEFARFQSWGWATTSAKLRPLLAELTHCYWMPEPEYLAFTKAALTPRVRRRLEVTPGRQPSHTLSSFFAWDETLALLTALRGLTHKKTRTRVIYNCGMGALSTHFSDSEIYKLPPFNMICPEEAWDYF